MKSSFLLTLSVLFFILLNPFISSAQVPQPIADQIGAKAREYNLGNPRSESLQPKQTPLPRNQGYWQAFERGWVYWSSATGAHVVMGDIFGKWASLSWEQGELGFPQTDELACTSPDPRDRFQRFQQGVIYWQAATRTATVFHYPVTLFGNDGKCPGLSSQPTKLLIIAPSIFQGALQPLVAHKNATGMSALLVTVDRLTATGRDVPEKIKRTIADAHERLGTTYVMLVGDASWIPVRYRATTIPPGERNWRDAWYTPADLYYANLYKEHKIQNNRIINSGAFDSWDDSGDGKFDEHHWRDDARTYNPDRVDGVPDVAVARVPAHTTVEVTDFVSKVIAYETGRAVAPGLTISILLDKNYETAYSLAKDMVLRSEISSLPGLRLNYIGLNYAASDALPDSQVQRPAYASVRLAADEAFWLSYIGHGSPEGWAANDRGMPLDNTNIYGYRNTHLPIVFAAGCGTGQFVNPPPEGKYRDIDNGVHWFWVDNAGAPTYVYDLGNRPFGSTPIREWRGTGENAPMITPPKPHFYDLPERSTTTFAASWLFNRTVSGGVAYFGETAVAPNDPGVALEARVLNSYARGDRVLGDMWMHGQQQYWKDFKESENRIEAPRVYLTYMTMFGDPSLRVR